MISTRYCRGRGGSCFFVVYMEYTTRTSSGEILYIASFTMFFVFAYAHHATSVSNCMARFLKDQIRWGTVTNSHVPPLCRCRSWCFPEAAQHAAWTVSWPYRELVSSALHSCCREAYCYFTDIFLHASAIIHTHIAIHSSYFAMVIRPTLFSGLLRVLVWQTTFTASCWAWSLVGRKSPFRMYSLLSTLGKRNSSANNYQFRKDM